MKLFFFKLFLNQSGFLNQYEWQAAQRAAWIDTIDTQPGDSQGWPTPSPIRTMPSLDSPNVPTVATDQVPEDESDEETAEEEPPTSDEEVECLPVTVHDGSTIEIYDDDCTMESPKEPVQETPKESEVCASSVAKVDVQGSAHPAPASMGEHGGATMAQVPGSLPDENPDQEKFAETLQEVLDSGEERDDTIDKSTKGVFKVREQQLLCYIYIYIIMRNYTIISYDTSLSYPVSAAASLKFLRYSATNK